MHSRGTRKSDIRTQNVSLLLNLIQQKGPIARYKLAQITGLSRATVSTICEILLKKGILTEVGTVPQKGENRGGPHPILLDLNANAYVALGIQFSKKDVKVGLVNLKGQILRKRRVPFSTHEGAFAKDIIQQACNVGKKFMQKFPKERILGVGVGAPGVIDRYSGTTLSDPYLQWENVPIKELIESSVGIPVAVDHNVRAMALAELRFGIGSKLQSFMEVYWSTGVGSGIVVQGKLYTGGTFGDGQLGHVVIDPDGPKCVCGNRGCLETFIGEDVLVSEIKSQFPDRPWNIRSMIKEALKGDTEAKQILEGAAQLLGVACADLINVLGIPSIVIGGALIKAGELIFKPVRDTLGWRVHPWLRDFVQVHPSALGEDLGLVGAASLALEQWFYNQGHITFSKDNSMT